MPAPTGFRILQANLLQIEEELTDERDKKKDLNDKQFQSDDPFVQKKMECQNKVEEAKASLAERAAAAAGAKGNPQNVNNVRENAKIRRTIKELKTLRDELDAVHKSEMEATLRKNKKKIQNDPSAEAVIKANGAKREQIIDVVQAEIDNLEYDRVASDNKKAEGARGGARQQTRKAVSRPKPPPQDLSELDAGAEGLEQAFMQIEKNDQEIDQNLDLIHAGVKRLGVMAEDMGTELAIQGTMIEEVKNKADEVNEQLETVNDKLRDAIEKSSEGKCCLNLICLVLILGIAGYIYKLVG